MANNRVLTIDITNDSVTIIEVTASTKKGTMVHNAVIFETPEGSYEDGFIKNKDALAYAIKDQLATNGISNKNAIFVLTSTKIVNREVMIPQVNEKKAKNLIQANASEYFPVNIDDYVVSHSILETVSAEKQMRALVVAAPLTMVRSYYDLAAMAGLRVQALDYIGNSMLQLIKTQTATGSTTMVIQLGGESSILNIVKGDTLLLQRTVPYGTNAVVQEVMNERNVDSATAMTLLQNERLITVDFDDNEITGAFRYLMNNIGRVMDYYASKNPDKPIDDVYLTGDGALIRGIEGLFKIQLNISTKIMDSLYNVRFDQSINMQIYNPVYLIASIGSAFAPMSFEIATEKSAKAVSSGGGGGQSSKILFVFLILVAMACAAGIAVTSVMKKNAEQEKASLEQQIAAIQDIDNIIARYEETQAKVEDMRALYNSTVTPNESMYALLTALEEKMPSSVEIASLSLEAETITFECTSPDLDTLVKFIEQFKSINCVDNFFATSVERAEDEIDGAKTGDVTYTTTCTCNYSTSLEAEDAGAAPVDAQPAE